MRGRSSPSRWTSTSDRSDLVRFQQDSRNNGAVVRSGQVDRVHLESGAVGDQDVFVNVVGGIRVQETAADLPVLLAVLSSLRDRPLPDKTIAFGEVGLSGEIRPVPNGEERLREAATHGFRRAIVPKANAPRGGAKYKDLEVIAVERLADALKHA